MTADITVETAHPMSAEADYDRRFLEPEIETASREQIAALQEKRILELVPYAWERSPFYRELWSGAGVKPGDIRSLDDFTTKIPTFCKDDIKAYRARTGDSTTRFSTDPRSGRSPLRCPRTMREISGRWDFARATRC